jgi:hypothetical protein
MVKRRFVHRSIREHLVAEHIAFRMTAEQAVKELLNHLWYDPDWEYAAPAALAMHHSRDQVIKDMMHQVTGQSQFPVDLTAIDACCEIRRFLARVAQESREDEWSPEAAEMIHSARLDLAISHPNSIREVVASDWATSKGLILLSLLRLLVNETDYKRRQQLADAIDLMALTDEDRARAWEILLSLLTSKIGFVRAKELARTVARPEPTAEKPGREALLRLLTHEPSPLRACEPAFAIACHVQTAEDRAENWKTLLSLLASKTQTLTPPYLAALHGLLAVTEEDWANSREPLLQLLADETGPFEALELVRVVVLLKPAVEDVARLRRALLRCLQSEWISTFVARGLVNVTVLLKPTAEPRPTARAPWHLTTASPLGGPG